MSARASILPVFVPHLGCEHQCVFCDQRRISGQTQPVTAERLRDLLAEPSARSGAAEAPQLAFYGGSFTAIPVPQQLELLEAAREAIARGSISSIRLSTRPDAIDEGTLARLRAFGVETIELGAQSMDDEVLARSGRGHSAQDVRAAARMIRAAGFQLVLQMMTGLPGDTPEKSLATARELIALRPDGVRIYPTVVVRGTPLYDRWLEGSYRAQSVDEAAALCARLVPLFDEAGIPVIRLGLNPTEELSHGGAVAGAYHPAFGELVRSRMMLERARALLERVPPGSVVTLGVDERLLSQLLGQKKSNIRALKEAFLLSELRVKTCPPGSGELRLLSAEQPEGGIEKHEYVINEGRNVVFTST